MLTVTALLQQRSAACAFATARVELSPIDSSMFVLQEELKALKQAAEEESAKAVALSRQRDKVAREHRTKVEGLEAQLAEKDKAFATLQSELTGIKEAQTEQIKALATQLEEMTSKHAAAEKEKEDIQLKVWFLEKSKTMDMVAYQRM